MKRVAIVLVAVIIAAVLVIIGLASNQPSEIRFDRSITVQASPADLEPYVHDLRKVVAWSPWPELDPTIEQTWSETTTGVGAWYAWSGNDDVGAGKQTIASVEPGEVVHRLQFLEPFEDEAMSVLSWTPTAEGIEVTWGFRKDSGSLGTKVAQVFMDLEAMIAPDYVKGLARLKPMVEQAAADRAEAEQKAAAAAEQAALEQAALDQAEAATATE